MSQTKDVSYRKAYKSDHLGVVDLEEMIVAFKELGISMEREEAFKLFNRMDQDGSLFISFNEWRDFLVRSFIYF